MGECCTASRKRARRAAPELLLVQRHDRVGHGGEHAAGRIAMRVGGEAFTVADAARRVQRPQLRRVARHYPADEADVHDALPSRGLTLHVQRLDRRRRGNAV